MDNNLSTGRSRLNSQLVAGAATIAGPAADLAAGASKMQVAANVLKDAFMEKLLGPTALFAGGLAGILLTMRKIVRESGILERGLKSISQLQGIEGKFETLLRSAELAKKRIQELYAFTANSPFKFDAVADANLQLLRLTKGAFAGARAMEMIGDAAAATGNQVQDMAHVVGRLYDALARGRSIDRVLFQFQGTGVVTDELAEKLQHLELTGASFSDKWAEVEKVLARTEGGMKKEMETLESLNAKLEESRRLMEQGFAAPFTEAQSNSIRVMTEATRNLIPVLAQVGRDMAAVSGLVHDFKTGIVENTLALPGMQKALLGVWEAVKITLAVLSAMTAISFVKGITEMKGFLLSTLGAASAASKSATAVEQLTKAKASLSAVTASLTRLQFLEAASAGLAAAKNGLLATMSILHAAGMKAAAGATGLAAVANYALGVSTVVAAKGLGLVRVALGFVLGQLKAATVALFTNPWTALIGALTLAAMAYYRWTAAARETARVAAQTAANIAAMRKELEKGRDGVKNLDDWQARMQKLRAEYLETAEAIAKFNAEVAAGEDKSAEQIGRNEETVTYLRDLRKELTSEATRDRSQLGLTPKEIEDLRQDQAERRDAEERDYQRRLNATTDPDARVRMQEQRAAELEARAAVAQASKDAARSAGAGPDAARREQLRNEAGFDQATFDSRRAAVRGRTFKANVSRGRAGRGGAEIARQIARQKAAFKARQQADLAAIDAEEKARAAARDEEIRQINLRSTDERVAAKQRLEDARKEGASREDLIRLERDYANAQARVEGANDLGQQAQDARQDAELSARLRARERADLEASAAFDQDIATAVASGNKAEVERLRFLKQQADLDRQIAAAIEDKNQALSDSLVAQKALNAAQREADQESFRKDAAVQRAIDDARARGDNRGAQALEDAERLRKMREEYAAAGMTSGQADADFATSLMAQAAGRMPGIVSDSRASIGGGGGTFQGRDPILAAQERSARGIETANGLLREIRDRLPDED
jgi:hypothetical protein